MINSKYNALALLAAGCLLIMGLFPIFTWQVFGTMGELQAELVFNIYALSYFNVDGVMVSKQENLALAWLSYGIAALLVSSIFLSRDALIQRKMLRTAGLLVGAQLFSFVVTSYRAGSGLRASSYNPNVGLTLILSIISLMILIFLILRQKTLAE